MMGASPAFASSPLTPLTNSPQPNGHMPYTPAPRDTTHSPVPESEFFLRRGVGGRKKKISAGALFYELLLHMVLN